MGIHERSGNSNGTCHANRGDRPPLSICSWRSCHNLPSADKGPMETTHNTVHHVTTDANGLTFSAGLAFSLGGEELLALSRSRLVIFNLATTEALNRLQEL